MQLGVIGLGRMGANIARRLGQAGHHCVIYDQDDDLVRELAGEARTPPPRCLDAPYASAR
jgi:6-phosphogluconate dehydrogenase